MNMAANQTSQGAGGDYGSGLPAPYVAPQLPEVAQPPQLPPQQPQEAVGAAGPQLKPGGPGSRAAGIAYLAQSFLKGMSRGREISDIKRAAVQQRTLSGLQFSYNNSAAKYLELKREGVSGPELEQTKAAVDASWSAMMRFYGRYFGEDQGQSGKGKKSKKAKGQGGDAQGNPMAALMGNNPQAKAQSWYQLAIKAGPPVYYQSRQFDSPEYRQQKELAKAKTEVESAQVKHQKMIADVQGKIDEIAEQQTPEQKQQLGTLEKQKKVLTGPPEEVKVREAMIDAATEDVTKRNGGKPPTPEQMDSILEAAGSLSRSDAGANWDAYYTYDKDGNPTLVGYVNKKDPSQFKPPPPELAGKHAATKQPKMPSQGGPKLGAGVQYRDKNGEYLGSWYPQARQWIPAPGKSAVPPKEAFGASGDKIYKEIKQKATDLDALSRQADKLAKNPTSSDAQALILQYVKAQIVGAGRIATPELTMAIKRGSYGTQIANWWEKATTGVPTQEWLQEMVDTIKKERDGAQEELKHLNESSSSAGGSLPPSTSNVGGVKPKTAAEFNAAHPE